jgi:hypothetical protein
LEFGGRLGARVHATVAAIFDAHPSKILASLRKDGSPRISAVEVDFVDGDLWLGMMFGSRKARDLQRDSRFALHSGSPAIDPGDPSTWPGEAKLSGLAVEVTDADTVRRLAPTPTGSAHLSRVDIREVVLTRIRAGQLVIDL